MNKSRQRSPSSLGSALKAVVARDGRSLLRALAMRKDRQTGIHEARKACRRLRGLLSFLPSGETTDALDEALRTMVHSLAPQRDAYIATRTARLLAMQHEASLTPEVIDALDHHATHVLDEALQDDPNWQRRRVEARRIIDALQMLPWHAIDSSSAKRKLKKAARKMKKAHEQAKAERTPEAFHRWRRRARKLRYQLELLRKARRLAGMKKRKTKEYGERAKHLSHATDQLGWRQDFQIFLHAVQQLPDTSGVQALRETLKSKSTNWLESEPPKN
jgi:CHAD domain-containing protein